MQFSLPFQAVVTVNLDNNRISADGVKCLADVLQSGTGTVISTLTLNYNCIDDAGVKYLVDALENNEVGLARHPWTFVSLF